MAASQSSAADSWASAPTATTTGVDLKGTPGFLGCSDVDPHLSEERVHETAEVFGPMDAEVTERIYEAWATASTRTNASSSPGRCGGCSSRLFSRGVLRQL